MTSKSSHAAQLNVAVAVAVPGSRYTVDVTVVPSLGKSHVVVVAGQSGRVSLWGMAVTLERIGVMVLGLRNLDFGRKGLPIR